MVINYGIWYDSVGFPIIQQPIITINLGKL